MTTVCGSGSGSLTSIVGKLPTATAAAAIFQLYIGDLRAFVASARLGGTWADPANPDAQMFLFNPDSVAVAANSDATEQPAAFNKAPYLSFTGKDVVTGYDTFAAFTAHGTTDTSGIFYLAIAPTKSGVAADVMGAKDAPAVYRSSKN